MHAINAALSAVGTAVGIILCLITSVLFLVFLRFRETKQERIARGASRDSLQRGS